jgi:Ca-activated chloride channel family protein
MNHPRYRARHAAIPALLLPLSLAACSGRPEQTITPEPLARATASEADRREQSARPWDARTDAPAPAEPSEQAIRDDTTNEKLEAHGHGAAREAATPATAPPPSSAVTRPRVETRSTDSYAMQAPASPPVPGESFAIHPHARVSPPPAAESFPVLPPPPGNTERYRHPGDNPIQLVAEQPVSTFSLDVDTGSYSNVRRFLVAGQRPPGDAVRVEEMINYFPYDYPSSDGAHPFGVRSELAPCPWNPQHWLLRVAVRAEDVAAKAMPPANLVFLVDVSGSMQDANKLPLLQQSLKLLVDQLRPEDRISLVVYAGSTGVVLEPTSGRDRDRVARAIDSLSAGGSTAGEAGIRLAYRMARQGFLAGGINRVLLATDGDFNVGVTDFEQLKDLVETERASGVQLSTLGFGTGNYNDALMEQLADVGNGSYAYVDNLAEGRKVLVDQVRSTLVTVAKDVKVQIEMNPGVVSEYRLIGYENRLLAREDFDNDRIDAGDVGAGQSVTALYELTPVGVAGSSAPLRYGSATDPLEGVRDVPKVRGFSNEVAFLRVRYKKPNESVSRLVETPIEKSALLASFERAGDDFRFAAAVAGFGQLLRGGRQTGAWTMDDVLGLAVGARGRDEFGYRSEFVSLVRSAKSLG